MRNWELSSVRRRGGTRDTINMFNEVAKANQEKLDKLVFTTYHFIKPYQK